jgi:hypothetical protein
MGWVPDLRAIHQHTDLYVHLPGMGAGGMGIAMAIAEAVPTLLERGTDIALLVGEADRHETSDEMFRRIWALLAYANLTAIGAAQRQRLAGIGSLETCGRSVLGLIREAQQLAASRII